MDLLLGLDIGTTSVKGLAIDARGGVLAFASQPLRLLTPHPGWVEQDPEGIWQAVLQTCRQVVSQLPEDGQICALSLSAQGGTTLPVDAAGQPAHPAFSWMDERAHVEARQAEAELGRDWIQHTTGWALFDGNPLNHIAWFRKHRPAEFQQTERFLFVNDFVLSRLCGQACMDPSDASITQLYNLSGGAWDQRLLSQAGIRADQLSPVRPSGEVVGLLTAQAAGLAGLTPGVPVVNGAHDQYCAALGTGVTWPGPVLLSCGTAWVVLAVPESPEVALQGGLSVSRHAVQGLWGAIRSLGGVGACVEWLLEQFWQGGEDHPQRYRDFNQAAAGSPPGARGLIFSPPTGGHAETGQPANRGLLGLSLSHTRGDIARALMEGIALELRWTLDEIAGAVQVGAVRMIGGAARSPVWPQIVADITRLPVELPGISEAASLGAAILAGVGAGWFRDADAAYRSLAVPGRSLLPQPGSGELSRRLEDRYRQLWDRLPHREEPVDGGGLE